MQGSIELLFASRGRSQTNDKTRKAGSFPCKNSVGVVKIDDVIVSLRDERKPEHLSRALLGHVSASTRRSNGDGFESCPVRSV